MRKKIAIIGLVLLGLFLLLLLKTNQPQEVALPEQHEATTNHPRQPKAIKNPQLPKISGKITAQAVAVASNATPSVGTSGSSPDPRFLAAWQTPIEFYGKVVDENSNAVPGVKVSFHWVEEPSESGNRSATTATDAEGMFSLHGQRGPSLSVTINKDGYFASHGGQQGFKYGPFGNPNWSPDPQNPVVFSLRKKGTPEPLIVSAFPVGMGEIAQLRHDGTPVEIDLFKGEKVSAGNGQLKLEFWRDVSNANTYDWKCQLSMNGGGLIEALDEFAFQAPKSGYKPSFLINMSATNQNWREDVRTKYYVQLPDGKFGRIDFYFLSYNGVFTVQSAINPTGSRNLEPAN